MTNEVNPTASGKTPKTIRLVRPSVVILCGPAACGKSTFAARLFRPSQIISSDRARALVCDDERDQRFNTEAFALVHFLVEQRLDLNRLCVIDSTALTQAARKSLLEIARDHQVPCIVLLLNVPLETCIERDQKRERSVGRSVIEQHYRLFEQAKGSLRQEGFEDVFELYDEQLGTLQTEVLFRPVPRKPAFPSTRPEAGRPGPRPASAPLRSAASPGSKPPGQGPRPAPPAPTAPVSPPPKPTYPSPASSATPASSEDQVKRHEPQ